MSVEVVEGEVTLSDGRTLAYVEWGHVDGSVVVLCHPATRVAQPGWETAAAVGVRVVFPDRPGFGLSTFKPGFAILDWPNDVAELMTHIGVDRFHVVGVSAATAYALACGVVLPDHVEAVGIIAGTTPPNYDNPTGVAKLAVDDPEAAFAEIRAERDAPGESGASARRASDRPEPDGSLYSRPEVQAALIAAGKETTRQGVDGVAWDTVLRIRPWGFELGDVGVPCQWWHGDADSVVPLQRVEQATAGLARHSLHVVAGGGHGVCMTHVEPFLRQLAGGDSSLPR